MDNQQIERMIREEARQMIREELTIEADFSTWSWGGSNELTIRLKLGDETISTTTETINWRYDSKDDY